MTTPTPLYDFMRQIQEEFNSFVLGEPLGGGKYRAVYEYAPDPSKVIKIERPHEDREFCNVTEWQVWNHLCDSDAGKWLAPCCAISRNGSFLVQQRCDMLPADRIPDRIPWFMTDFHENNWGVYEGRPVLFDYGFLYGFMRKAKYEESVKLVSRKLLAKSTKPQ